jgi:hypothetical protein
MFNLDETRPRHRRRFFLAWSSWLRMGAGKTAVDQIPNLTARTRQNTQEWMDYDDADRSGQPAVARVAVVRGDLLAGQRIH